MAEAGSVAPVFRDGGYDATTTYDFYHAIIHNNKLYFCRQDGTIGHEPQEKTDEYWFLSLDGNIADAVTLNGKTEEELSVGNAFKLNGLTAEEFVVNENLLKNPDFALNTNGQTEYVGTQITVDGWEARNDNTTITVHDGYITLSNTEDDARNHYIQQQWVEYLYAGQTLTLSLEYRNAVGKPCIHLVGTNGGYRFFDTTVTDWTKFSGTWTIGADGLQRIVPALLQDNAPVGSIDIRNVKLELGSVATPFVPPNPEIEAVKCGVADADTVDGWNIINNPSELGFTSQFTMAELCAAMPDKTRLVWPNTSTATVGATDTPSTYGMIVVERRGTFVHATWIRVNVQGKTPLYSGSWHGDNGWTGWSSSEDFCLPLTGGTLSDTLVITKENYCNVHLKNPSFARDGSLPTTDIYSTVNILEKNGENLGAFQNSVSKSGNVHTQMSAYRNNATKEYCQLGVKFGIDGVHYPFYRYNGGADMKLLHTGNKPTGSYTGNGSATERTISTGGMGSVCVITGNGVTIFVSHMGGFWFNNVGTNSGTYAQTALKFYNGVLTIASEDIGFNKASATYTYQVL